MSFRLAEEKMGNDIINQLEAFKQKVKFVEDYSVFYPGISDASMQESLSDKVNSVASEFKNLVLNHQVKDTDFQYAILDETEVFCLRVIIHGFPSKKI